MTIESHESVSPAANVTETMTSDHQTQSIVNINMSCLSHIPLLVAVVSHRFPLQEIAHSLPRLSVGVDIA